MFEKITVSQCHLVAYTDGSASPNPGVTGSCSHGYVYQELSEKPYRVGDNIYATDGYRHAPDGAYVYLEEPETQPVYVKPEYLIEMRQSSAYSNTNNYAEVTALLQLLQYLVDNQLFFKSVLVHSDSTYVVNTIQEFQQTYKNNKQHAVADLFEVEKQLKILRDNGCDFSIQWIKGHRGHLGNEICDFGANIARNDSQKGFYEPIVQIVSYKDFESKKINIHPLLCFNNLVCNLSKTETLHDPVYCQLRTSLPDNLVGKMHKDSTYSVVILKETIPVIENVRTILDRSKFYNSINLIKLAKVRQKNYYSQLMHLPYTRLSTKKTNNTLVSLDGEVISVDMTPPGLLLYVLENYDLLLDIISSPNVKRIDITEEFYRIETDKKGKSKVVLRDEIKMGYNSHPYSFNLGDNKVSLDLILGADLPDRNVLKHLEDENPLVRLVMKKVGDKSYEYFITISTSIALSAWGTFSTNKIFL